MEEKSLHLPVNQTPRQSMDGMPWCGHTSQECKLGKSQIAASTNAHKTNHVANSAIQSYSEATTRQMAYMTDLAGLSQAERLLEPVLWTIYFRYFRLLYSYIIATVVVDAEVCVIYLFAAAFLFPATVYLLFLCFQCVSSHTTLIDRFHHNNHTGRP